MDNHLSAPIAQYGPDLYFCIADGNVFWLNVEDFRNPEVPVRHLKRYLVGNPIDRLPITTDDSIYLAGGQAGVTRLGRKSFERVWRNTEVDRVFSVGPKLVYAGDHRGNLMVLDRLRGLTLATLDIRAFPFYFENDQDDRLFLAGQDGLILCLHDRSLRRPVPIRPNEPSRAKVPDLWSDGMPKEAPAMPADPTAPQ
jgi:hypothetical protein